MGEANDILRRGSAPSASADTTAGTSGDSASASATVTVTPNAQDRLARTTQTLTAVRQMQDAARKLAVTGPNNLKSNLPAVPVNSYGVSNGLLLATGVPKDLLKPTVTEDASLWVGANLPTVTTQTTNGSTTSEVTIQQTQQQAVLNWQSFNIGKSTTLTFDQSAGGEDVGNWIAFNKVGVTGSPSQILGSIKAAGQVYVINPNGIIFGGSSQVNAHALVASSLPINDNLIQRGLLNNPDGQFLFSGLTQAAGTAGPTDAFSPSISDLVTFSSASGGNVATTQRRVSDISSVKLSYVSDTAGATALIPTTDYTVALATGGQAVATLTPAGQAKVGAGQVALSYLPSSSDYGDVVVQAGATLFSPTSAASVGGRIALIGPNVKNSGTLSSPDGQVILAAGLQVGFAAHAQSDPSLRGLDVYVGKVTDASADKTYSAGAVTNDRTVDSGGNVSMGLLETTDLSKTDANGVVTPLDRPGAITLVGKTINQLGVINSQTTVSFNGRVDLLANYNAVANAAYNPTLEGSLPFVFPTNDATTGLQSTGVVTLGPGSLIRILPSDSLTDRINRTVNAGLALRSQINLQGSAIHLATDVAASATTIPTTAQLATIQAPNAEVSLQAGSWVLLAPGANQVNNFLFSGGQVYLDRGASIDVAGTQVAVAPVTENLVSVELRGAELADSPLQQNGPLRGQTVQVDLRIHGPWDPTLNGGLGGYSWIGTPVADASGYVALVQRTAAELTTNGGTVNIQAGGSVVMQPGSKIDVSGGWTDFQAGYIQTTKVLSGGHIYDISQATPERRYDAVFNGTTSTIDPKWGITETTAKAAILGYNDPGYTQGADGGKIAITSASVALDGTFAGQTVSGPRQFLTSPTAGSTALITKPSEFSLTFGAQVIDPVRSSATNPVVLDYSPTPPNVIFQAGTQLSKDAPVAAFTLDSTGAYALSTLRKNEVDVSPDLVNSAGFGFLSIDNENDNVGANGRSNPTSDFGRIVIPVNPAGAAQPLLVFSPGSALSRYLNASVQSFSSDPVFALSLTAANIDLLGGVEAPGGSLRFKARNISSSLSAQTVALGGSIVTANAKRGAVNVGAQAFFDVAGQLINFHDPLTDPSVPRATDGGEVSLTGFKTTVATGSKFDVSGGATVSGTGKVTFGAAGKVSIAVANEQQFDGARLVLPATYTGDPKATFAMQGYSGSNGGEFDLTAPLIQIGGTSTTTGGLVLNPALFGLGGFSTFRITGLADSSSPTAPGLLIGSSSLSANPTPTPAAVVIAPQVLGFQADLRQTGSNILQTFLPDAPFRSGAKLYFTAAQGNSQLPVPLVGGLMMGANASIQLTPNAGDVVSFAGDTVTLLGQAKAPGGTISVAGATVTESVFHVADKALPTVYLGPKSVLSTAGAPLLALDARGYTVGSILAGGAISVKGNIVAEAGSLLDASGSTGALDVSPFQTSLTTVSNTSLTGMTLVRATVDSNGGSISLEGGQELFSDATLVAKAGGASALGGSLSVQSGLLPSAAGGLPPATLPTLLLTSSGPTLPVTFSSQGKTAIGQLVVDKNGKAISTAVDGTTNYFGGALATSTFSGGGFDALTFGGAVKFSGTVSLKAGSSVVLGTGGVVIADTKVLSSLAVDAPYVALGAAFRPPAASGESTTNYANVFAPTYGDAGISVSGAKVIDIGNLALLNVGYADLTTVSGGEIRGDGTFDLAGVLTMTAGQVYPTTAAQFNLSAYDFVDSHGVAQSGSITLYRRGTPTQVPLSAGGELNVFASTIEINGVLRAPLGTINLGRDATDATIGSDPITAGQFPTTKVLTLGSGSVVSVSTLDLVTGKSLSVPIPYGNNLNGSAWIDPTGADITVEDSASRTAKRVKVSAATIDDQAGSSIDLTGGSDLYAYNWVSGTSGTKDVLNAYVGGFAVLPGYSSNVAPYAAFNNSTAAQENLGGDPGYVSLTKTASGGSISKLGVGDSIYIDLHDGKGPQTYTLLPARYALLPGAYLVTPQNQAASVTTTQDDGSLLTAGYRFNALDASRSLRPLYTLWEVASSAVVRTRGEYNDSLANTFFPAAAAENDVAVRRLPVDAGSLVLSATKALTLQGRVSARPQTAADGSALGRGGAVDISSVQDILITGPDTVVSSPSSSLVLNSADLTAFGADSLLIGGIRTEDSTGTNVSVSANSLTVDNAGAPLSGADIILVANKDLTLAANSVIKQTRTLTGTTDNLQITGHLQLTNTTSNNSVAVGAGGLPIQFPNGLPSNSSLLPSADGFVTASDGTKTNFTAGTSITSLAAGSTITLSAAGSLSARFNPAGDPIRVNVGDGALVRVTSDLAAEVTRSGVVSSLAPHVTIGAGATVSGANVTLDSTQAFTLDPTARLSAKSLSLGSGQISFQLSNPGTLLSTTGLVLPATALQSLQVGANALSFLSYSSIDIYGSGTIGTLDSAGKPTLASLALHTGEIRGFSNVGGGGDVTFAAKNILLDNLANGVALGATQTPVGSLRFDAGDGEIHLGANTLAIDQYGAVAFQAGGGLLAADTGKLSVQKDLSAKVAVLTASTGANQTIVAGGKLAIAATGGTPTVALDGLGAQLNLTGATVAIDGNITLHSGTVTVQAAGDVSIGSAASSRIDVSGVTRTFYDVSKPTDAGIISLFSTNNSVTVGSAGVLDLSAPAAAGTLNISAPKGAYILSETAQLLGQGGTDGSGGADGALGGSFTLDTGTLASTASLDRALNPGTLANAGGVSVNVGGFVRSRSIRVRTGDVAIDGLATAHSYGLSADQGTVTVTEKGKIDASGKATDATGANIDVAGKLADGSWKTDANGHVLDANGATLDLSGGTGGVITLSAHGSLILQSGATLTTAGTYVDAAGKGGLVSLEAGSSKDGVAPSVTDTRDAATGAFLLPTTPVVDVRTGSKIDLSVATNSIALAAGQKFQVSHGSVGGDLLVADSSGTVLNADGTTLTFSAGLLPQFAAGSSITLDNGGHLTYLEDAFSGRFSGTLHLRAPQTTPAPPVGSNPALAPDVQINPINGTILNPSSIVVEGYKTYAPVAG